MDDLDSVDESVSQTVTAESKAVKVPVIEMPLTATAQHSIAKRSVRKGFGIFVYRPNV